MRVTDSFIQGDMSSVDIATAAQRQYFSRPGDQRFASTQELYDYVDGRKMRTSEFNAEIVDMAAHVKGDNGIVFQAKSTFMEPTHFAFGQFCGLVGAPTQDLRKIASEGA